MADPVHEIYGNRLRVRACGILVENEQLLLVNHRGLTATEFWAPPGGGLNFGEPAPAVLQREMREETGLETEVGDLLFTCEFIRQPLHAIELFFTVRRTGGILATGHDPEMNEEDQLIQSVRFMSWNEIGTLKPETLHGIFRFAEKPQGITGLRGYFRL